MTPSWLYAPLSLQIIRVVMLRSGLVEGIPYSLSRWTDISSKWAWFEACLDSKKMVAFDPRTSAPGVWSLSPEDTLGLVFWTKDPTALIQNRARLAPYDVTVHVTATGWAEVEKGTPSIEEAGQLLVRTAQAFRKTYWRFSPIPILPDAELLRRFQKLLGFAAIAGIKQTFVSFLQENDKLPENRTPESRFALLNSLADMAHAFGVQVVLCRDDRTFEGWSGAQFTTEACVQPADFGGQVPLEDCGCVLMVDPFTINEACSFGCHYCYASDKSLSVKKRNTTRTTRSLHVVR